MQLVNHVMSNENKFPLKKEEVKSEQVNNFVGYDVTYCSLVLVLLQGVSSQSSLMIAVHRAFVSGSVRGPALRNELIVYMCKHMHMHMCMCMQRRESCSA